MDENILDRVKKLHFVGIGGSGMCPMAEILHHKGFQLTGSDINESDTLERIKGYGIPVAMGHKAENIGDAECVVYTAACKADNPELVAAREKGIPTLERSVMLGMLTEKFKRPVAVSGTHGKTTTTAMLTEVLIDVRISGILQKNTAPNLRIFPKTNIHRTFSVTGCILERKDG